MKAQEFMKKSPAVCTPEDTLQEAAQLMEQHDCGSIPVVENKRDKKLVGMITDRDIACRAVARGKSDQFYVKDVMTKNVVTVTPHTPLSECCKTMKEKQLRRLVVADENRAPVGIVCQSHIARHATKEQAGEVLAGISQSKKHARVA